MSMNASPGTLDALFHKPSRPSKTFGLIPARIPGPNAESVKALVEYLKDNHRRHHIFFNDEGFHNHATHHLLAIYALGADKKLLHAAYQTHVLYQRPAFPSPGDITGGNWKDYLGDEKYYQAYVTFFANQLLEKGPGPVVEQYVFSKDANLVPGAQNSGKPYMLSRYLGGFLHALIHAGYGAEFGQLGMWAEGLAEACAEKLPVPSTFFPDSLFDTADTGIVNKLGSLTLSSGSSKRPSVHALIILARVAADPAFESSALGLPLPPGGDIIKLVADRVGGKLLAFLDEWTVEPNQEDLQRKTEELIWLNTVIYGVGGWAGREQAWDINKKFNADFLSMHLVTSVLFIPSTIAYLKPSSAVTLLKAYFLTSIALYIARGRPAIPISDFYQATSANPVAPGVQPTPTNKFFRNAPGTAGVTDQHESVWEEGSKILTPNPWLPLIQTTLVHPNEHLCKLQRALAHFATEFGETEPGTFKELASEGLKGAEVLDGTLFIRVANLTADRLGWIREGQEMRGWDFGGFYPGGGQAPPRP